MQDFWHEIKNIFHFIILFECLLLSIFLLGTKSEYPISKRFLVMFFITIAIISIGGILAHFVAISTVISQYFPQSHYILFPFRYLVIPLLFFYVLSVTITGFEFKTKHLIHFVLFGYFVIRVLVQFYLFNTELLREKIISYQLFGNLETHLYTGIDYLQHFSYTFFCIFLLNKYQDHLKNQFSSIEKVTLNWLNLVLWGLVIWKFLKLCNLVIVNTIGSDSLPVCLYIIAQLMFIYLMGYITIKALKQPVILIGINGNNYKKKYEKNLLSNHTKELYEQRIINFMETEKPYLDSSFNLQKLSEMVNTPSYHISQILNTYLHLNFYDFVNQYRIAESKNLLKENTEKDRSILEILYESGFNSKSVFNTAFKKHTGITPSEFRRSQIQE